MVLRPILDVADYGVPLRAYLSCQFWGKASNFRGLFAFLLHRVATINIAYIEKIP